MALAYHPKKPAVPVEKAQLPRLCAAFAENLSLAPNTQDVWVICF